MATRPAGSLADPRTWEHFVTGIAERLGAQVVCNVSDSLATSTGDAANTAVRTTIAAFEERLKAVTESLDAMIAGLTGSLTAEVTSGNALLKGLREENIALQRTITLSVESATINYQFIREALDALNPRLKVLHEEFAKCTERLGEMHDQVELLLKRRMVRLPWPSSRRLRDALRDLEGGLAQTARATHDLSGTVSQLERDLSALCAKFESGRGHSREER